VTAESIRVRGLVQGVGFRPTVWRLARACGLRGDVRNDGEGVLIRVCGSVAGDDAGVSDFLTRLREECPPLARIDSIERRPIADPQALADLAQRADFVILESAATAVHTGIVADAATCAACVAEIRDPADRRFRYPFTNCTHCGPRLSIVAGIPYDRARTSMSAFPMCPDCAAEYKDPADRRFHAQPNACPVCGPKVWLQDAAGRLLDPNGARCRGCHRRGEPAAGRGADPRHQGDRRLPSRVRCDQPRCGRRAASAQAALCQAARAHGARPGCDPGLLSGDGAGCGAALGSGCADPALGSGRFGRGGAGRRIRGDPWRRMSPPVRRPWGSCCPTARSTICSWRTGIGPW
jgi:acylphosphatase